MIETSHNEHKIRYNEGHSEDWECPALGLKSKSLAGLKTKLNEFDSKERKLGKNGVLLFKLEDSSFGFRPVGERVRATMLEKGIQDGDNHAVVWVTDESGSRSKCGTHALILDTPENMAILEEAKKIDAQSKALKEQAANMRKNIKRITIPELKAMALETKPE